MTHRAKNLIQNNKFICSLAALMAVYLMLISCFSSIRWNEAVGYWIFQVAFIIIPGMAIISCFQFKEITELQLFTYSYAIGYSLMILNYFIISPLGLKRFAFQLSLIEFVVALFVLFVRKQRLADQQRCDILTCNEKLCLLFICVFFLIRFLLILERTFCQANKLLIHL